MIEVIMTIQKDFMSLWFEESGLKLVVRIWLGMLVPPRLPNSPIYYYQSSRIDFYRLYKWHRMRSSSRCQ